MSQLHNHIAALISVLFSFEIIVGGSFTYGITVKVVLAGPVSSLAKQNADMQSCS